jgi:DNA-binding transcriptional LysR family regulator
MRSFDPVQLGSIEIFCKAAELHSFSSAAEVLGLTPASISRSISRLESRLGVRLFARTTRHIRLTTEGEIYRRQCQQALEQIAEVERLITGTQKVLSGNLRISVGTPYAHHRLLPLISKFQSQYPQIELEISISNRVIDFVDDGFDLAIRLGKPKDSRLIAHKLEDATLGIFASPDYLKKWGEPVTLDDICNHNCITFILPSTGKPRPWVFKDDRGNDIDMPIKSCYSVSDDVLGTVNWAVSNGGLFQTYHFIAESSSYRGKLVEVLKNYSGRTRQFSILYPQNRHLSARVKAFVDFLKKEIKEINANL